MSESKRRFVVPKKIPALITMLGTCKSAESTPTSNGWYRIVLHIEGDAPHDKAVEEWHGAEIGILQRHDRPVLVDDEESG